MGSLNSDEIRIPVIDISDNNPNAPAQLLDAACRFGFVFVANDNSTGIPPSSISQLFNLSTQLFALSPSTKQKCSIASNKAGKNHGYLSQGIENLDPTLQQRPDVKEAFNLGPPNPDGTYPQPLPDLLKHNIETLNTFQKACIALCHRVLTHFATALGIPSDWFTARHDGASSTPSRASGEHGSILRLLYYPKRTTSSDSIDIRAGAHSDYGSVTCLFQVPGQPGLEILTPEGEWVGVPVDPLGKGGSLPILVNIGDLLEDWTGGLLRSTRHRVVFPKGEGCGDRYSIAYFCHPLDEAVLEPVPSRLVEEHVRVHGRRMTERDGKIITARDHLMERLAATYKIK